METLGIYQFIRNGIKYDYPFIESIKSAIPIADEIVICECYSEDDTYAKVMELAEQEPKIKVIRHPWVEDFRGLSEIGNYCIPHLNTDWHWQLQADEVIHEMDYPVIKQAMDGSLLRTACSALSINFHHFMANYETEFDFVYLNAIRIARKNSGWWLTGDAVELAGGIPSQVFRTAITVYHYGKVHAGKVGWQKEWDFQQLFKEIGFPDPKMQEMSKLLGEEFCDYLYLFESTIKEGRVRKFEGTHPAIMKDRIAEFKDNGWEQFQSKIKEGLKL